MRVSTGVVVDVVIYCCCYCSSKLTTTTTTTTLGSRDSHLSADSLSGNCPYHHCRRLIVAFVSRDDDVFWHFVSKEDIAGEGHAFDQDHRAMLSLGVSWLRFVGAHTRTHNTALIRKDVISPY